MARILVVDDEFLLRISFTALLKQKGGHEVLEAAGGETALDLLAHEIVDLIVSDYHMPGMDGDQFLKALRMQGNTTPFLLHTSDLNAKRTLETLCATYGAVFRGKQDDGFMDAVNAILAQQRV